MTDSTEDPTQTTGGLVDLGPDTTKPFHPINDAAKLLAEAAKSARSFTRRRAQKIASELHDLGAQVTAERDVAKAEAALADAKARARGRNDDVVDVEIVDD